MPGQPRPMRGNMPEPARSAGTCTTSCSTPPTITPHGQRVDRLDAHARRTTGAAATWRAIIDRFSSTGEAAGTANRRQVLRMPPASATSDMKPM